MQKRSHKTLVLSLGAATLLISGSAAQAQTSSLFQRDLPTQQNPQQGYQAPAVTLSNSSWTYRQLPPPKEIRLHDIVKIRVDERAIAISEGDAERRVTKLYDAQLKDWLQLDGLRAVRKAPQSNGDPRIQGTLSNQSRAESDIETMEKMTFDIAAEVVDIRPNGNLVLEARKNLIHNEENWEYSLIGICRKEDILPNNTVMSQNMANLRLNKREAGFIRDSYKRGWATRFFDLVKPF